MANVCTTLISDGRVCVRKYDGLDDNLLGIFGFELVLVAESLAGLKS